MQFLKNTIRHFMVKMVNYNKNTIFENIKQETSLTDKVLFKKIAKSGLVLSNAEFEKILLDLEIAGLISVSWITKDSRRIEVVIEKQEVDEYEDQIKEEEEKSYEASFPGTENGL